MTERWGTLFDRASSVDVTPAEITEAISSVRDATEERSIESNGEMAVDPPGDGSDPSRIVADVDVLVADLFVEGPARESLDHVRGHDWLSLVASDPLLTAVERTVTALADGDLARDHRDRLDADRVGVSHPPEDHPALASAYAGGAAHLLTTDERLTSATTGLALRSRFDVSVRPPAAFAALFDPESLYEHFVGGTYSGPDRDPRG